MRDLISPPVSVFAKRGRSGGGLPTWSAIAAALLLAVSPAYGRTECKDDVTAPCVELAGHVGRYDQLLWAICSADSKTVCKCWNAQQRDYGVDWCQWADCACSA